MDAAVVLLIYLAITGMPAVLNVTAPILAAGIVLYVGIRRRASWRGAAYTFLIWAVLSFCLSAVALFARFGTHRWERHPEYGWVGLCVMLLAFAVGIGRNPGEPRAPPARWRDAKILLALAVTLIAGSYVALNVYQWRWYLGKLPAAIETDYPVVIDSESGIREGCGVAIFRLSARSREAIETDGLAFFDTALAGRSAEPSYERWRSTPAAGRSLEHTELASILLGLSCADASRSLQETIFRAIQTSGSYYTLTSEAALLVIPAQRLVVFGHFG